MALAECLEGGYKNEELCEVIAEKTIRYKERLKQKPFHLSLNNAFLLSGLQHALKGKTEKDTLRVLDFGGACGSHYFEMERFLPNTKLLWTIVETPTLVKIARQKNIGSENLFFKEALTDAQDTDLIYSSGALQYTEKPYEYLKKLMETGAEHIIFSRMMLNKKDRDIITIHKSPLSWNGPGPLPKEYQDKQVSYPITIMSFEKFNKQLLENYTLDWFFEENDEYPKLYNEENFGCGLLYTKKS